VKKFSDALFTGFCWISGLGILMVMALLLIFLMLRGIHSLSLSLFFGETPWLAAVTGQMPVFDGIWPALVGTFLLVLLSSVLAMPVGIASGIYLAEYAPRRRRVFLGWMVDFLSGTPSIVMGLFGFAMILLLRRTFAPRAQTGLLLASCCIALLILPYLIRTTEAAIDGIPDHLRLLGPCMGLSKWQNIRHVLLPTAGRGIFSGIVLAIGRAAEDTAVILLTGVVAHAGLPRNLLDRFEALPFRIYYLAAEHRNAGELEQGFGAALVLLCITGMLFLAASFIQRRAEKWWQIR
jgi:phosphate transport system permease protein